MSRKLVHEARGFLRWLAGTFRHGLGLLPIGLALAVFLIGAFVGAQLLLSGFRGTVTKVQNWQAGNPVSQTGVAAGELFAALLANEEKPLIRFDKTTGTIEVSVDCAVENAGLGPQWKTEDTKKLITRLCQTDIGRTILGEVGIWNNTGQVLAIRDNRHLGKPCRDGRTSVLYVPARCHESEWRAGVDVNGQIRSADVPSGASPSTETFGFMADSAPPGFGDWLTVKVNDVGLRSLVFVTTIAPVLTEKGARKTRDVTIDLIGDVESVRVNGVVRTIATEPKPNDQQASTEVRNDVGKLICDARRNPVRQCQAGIEQAGSRVPRGRRLVIKARGQRLRVEVFARALRVLPPSITGLENAQMIDQSREGVRALVSTEPLLRLTSHIGISCVVQPTRAPDVGNNLDGFIVFRPAAAVISRQRRCWLNWRSVTRNNPRQPGLVSIVTSGGQSPVALTRRVAQGKDKAGNARPDLTVATEMAGQLGLLPVVGLDHTDYFSLLGQATARAAAKQVAKIELTIDPQLQLATLGVIRNIVERKKGPRGVLPRLTRKGDNDRRAVVVLMDAGPVGGGHDAITGAVRAVVSYPAFRRGLSRWDVLANERFRPTQSRLAPRGWAQSDRFFAPGSTMKVVTTLAAIDKAARGDGRLARLLPGHPAGTGLSNDEVDGFFTRDYGWALNSKQLKVPFGDDGAVKELYRMKNHPGFREGKRFERTLCQSVTGACNPSVRLTNSLALIRSSNMWFGRLALALDEDKISCRTPRGRREITGRANPCAQIDPSTGREFAGKPQPIMVTMIDRLWPEANRQLIADFEAQNWRKADRGARFQAETMRLGVGNVNRPRRVSLTLNGIGQSVQATPLAMATIMASVAAGVVVAPRLSRVRRANQPSPLIPRDGGNDGQADVVLATQMLGGLRQALRDVARAPAGTAFNGLADVKDLRRRIYGKTGTAQVGARPGVKESPPNTVWFVGWIDGLGKGLYKDRRIAFACAITHVRARFENGKPSGSGGSVCAPVIGAVLKQFEIDEANANTDTKRQRR